MTYAHDVTALVGNTPLVRINRVTDGAPATVLAKVEAFEPASSVKDRIALSIVRAAERSGELQPGGTIVEATSGNTGVGLAMVGAALGYRVVITMPETFSKERRAIMRAFGAELVLTTEGGVAGAVKRAEEIQAATPNSILASQFANPANPQVHRETTAREILEATGGELDVFVAGIGTGGTLTGVGQVLREEKPEVTVVGVEPAESPLLSEGSWSPHKIQGIGPNIIPEVLDQEIWDELLHVESQAAITYARRAAAEEGLLVGISSGAALAAAVQLAQRPEMEGKTIVTVLPDTGERYLSTVLFQDLLD
ncbi:cysteine synthase A [Actinomyces sp. 2119]|uniref:Cysteine synthase n=1 Tax=Actinomyces lilanjuaniae TaxID=2321394 RepID=A0ABN5PMH4_9ACTO|nr:MULTISPECIES: cysteine synthase A [Actinomyces]AYD89487.1 cysteine synthase A [Actinomyces lilanjuaniae]RJF43151.1 cysteine synthase A [Actinomyces sp. 2119]